MSPNSFAVSHKYRWCCMRGRNGMAWAQVCQMNDFSQLNTYSRALSCTRKPHSLRSHSWHSTIIIIVIIMSHKWRSLVDLLTIISQMEKNNKKTNKQTNNVNMTSSQTIVPTAHSRRNEERTNEEKLKNFQHKHRRLSFGFSTAHRIREKCFFPVVSAPLTPSLTVFYAV